MYFLHQLLNVLIKWSKHFTHNLKIFVYIFDLKVQHNSLDEWKQKVSEKEKKTFLMLIFQIVSLLLFLSLSLTLAPFNTKSTRTCKHTQHSHTIHSNIYFCMSGILSLPPQKTPKRICLAWNISYFSVFFFLPSFYAFLSNFSLLYCLLLLAASFA